MDDLQKATLAAGCFWGVQYYFDQVPGVISSKVGYTGGKTENPSYENVCYDATGHAEAIEIEFDPKKVSYETLLRHFFRLHDPTQLNKQGPDIGDQYRSAVFYHNDQQKELTKKIKKEVQKDWKNPVVTQVVPAGPFYAAEDYHQKYTEKTGQGMCHIPYKSL